VLGSSRRSQANGFQNVIQYEHKKIKKQAVFQHSNKHCNLKTTGEFHAAIGDNSNTRIKVLKFNKLSFPILRSKRLEKPLKATVVVFRETITKVTVAFFAAQAGHRV
jgi:hypothetical protein